MLYTKSLLSLLLTIAILPLHGQQAPLLPQQDLNKTELDFNKAQQDEFNEMLAALQEMPEDKLQEFEKALEEEVKQELQKMSPQERKEFDDKMAEFWLAQGIDPNSIPPIEEMFAQPTDNIPEEQPQEPQAVLPESGSNTPIVVPAKQSTSLHSETEVAEMLDSLIKHTDSLRTKAASSSPEFKRLGSWKEALDELSYDLKMINKSEHHARLTGKEFSRLFKILQNLRDKLTFYEPLVEEVAVEETDNPYEILRLPSNASDELIEKTYKKYAAERDPATLRAKLTAEGLSENDIDGQIRSAQLSLNTLTEAYEKLSDPKLRAQTDRSLKSARLYRESAETESKKALDALLQTLSTAVYQQKILTELEQFLQKYAPTELAAHKKMMEAEAKRKKEQADASKIQPAIGYVAPEYYPYNPTPSYQPQAAQPNYGNYYPDYYPDQYEPQGAPAGKEEKDKKAGGGDKGADKGKEKSKEDKDKKEKEADKKLAQEKDKKEKAKPTAEDEWKEAVKKVTTELENAQKALNSQSAADKKAFDEAQALLRQGSEEQAKRRAAGEAIQEFEPLPDQAKQLIENMQEIETQAEKDRQEQTKANTERLTAGVAAGEDEEELRGQLQKQLKEAYEKINAEALIEKNQLFQSAQAVNLHTKLKQLFEKVPVSSLNKAVKTLALATEKAQEFGFALPYGTTWKKLADKHQDIFNLAEVYQVTTAHKIHALEERQVRHRAPLAPLAEEAAQARAEAVAKLKKEQAELKKTTSAIDDLGKNLAELQELIQPGRRMNSPRAPQENPADQMRAFQDAKLHRDSEEHKEQASR